jgi:thioredoxin-dependent peroxiredoxin
MSLKAFTLAFGLIASATTSQAQAALKVGDTAPAFKVMAATDGKVAPFTLSDALKKGPVVVYFYPKAFTSGCSLEAREFSENMDQFKAMKISVIGLSNDDIPTLQRFSKADCQGKFPVGADVKAKIAQTYDAKIPAVDMAARVSYLIGQDGKIDFVHSDRNAATHVETLLAAAKKIK